MKRLLTCIVLVLMGLAGSASAAIIDHNSVDTVATLGQDTMDAIGAQTWFFSHASVGSNMMSGMATLHATDPTRYPLVGTAAGYNSSLMQANTPPATTLAGRIYECSRGNPGWANKITIFENSVTTAGWRSPTVDVVMDKMCYIDQSANATAYLTSMATLEASYPDTVFVYMTMPLTTSTDSNNTLRNSYNNTVRQYCITNERLLFDIADMEAHDPAGTEYTYGASSQRMYSGYTDDGGHLNALGRERIAMGWYAVAAAVTGELPPPCIDPIPGDANCDGVVNLDDFVILKSHFGMTSGASWRQGDFDGNGQVSLVDFSILKNHFGMAKEED